jgi:protein SCO1/2
MLIHRFFFALFAVLGTYGCSPSRRLPVYGEAPDFVLTSQAGQEFTRRGLEGKIWAADFIFTNCTGPCPRMSAQMRQIQKAVREIPNVNLISFTVDPRRDTPAVLAAYARRFQAEPARWVFLTGAENTLRRLKGEAFRTSAADGGLIHSTSFLLIDGRARIRGYYASFEPEGLRQLVADIRLLAKERS